MLGDWGEGFLDGCDEWMCDESRVLRGEGFARFTSCIARLGMHLHDFNNYRLNISLRSIVCALFREGSNFCSWVTEKADSVVLYM